MQGPDDRIRCVLELVLANPWNAIILERTAQIGLADWWLTAGCVAQSVWNARYGKPPGHGIIDYDVFYFDPDTGWDAEDAVIRKTAAVFRDLPVTVQIRNQARVPLWYEGKFGVPFPPVRAASDGIDRFPCASVAVGVRRQGEGSRVHAPFGVEFLLKGVLVPNPVLPIPGVYAVKVGRWCEVWPELVVHPWPTPALKQQPEPPSP